MPEALPAAIRIVLPTDLVFVRVGRKCVESVLAGQSWSEEDVEDAALIATELIQNAIEHGSRVDGTESTEVSLWVQGRAASLEVIDPGTGKDPDLLLRRDVTAPVSLDSPRGRGLFLIHRLAAGLERDRHDSGGCVVRVRLECSEE